MDVCLKVNKEEEENLFLTLESSTATGRGWGFVTMHKEEEENLFSEFGVLCDHRRLGGDSLNLVR